MAPEQTGPLKGTGKRRSCLTWNSDLRLGLHLLDKEFSFKITERTAIFNEMFRTHIQGCGLIEGVSYRPLSAQLGERPQISKAHIWAGIVKPNGTPEDDIWRDVMKDCIRQAAQRLELLDLSVETQLGTSPRTPLSIKRKRTSPSTMPLHPKIGPQPLEKVRKKRLTRRDPIVVIPVFESKAVIVASSAPKTPRKQLPRSPPRTPNSNTFHRRYGGDLTLKPERHRQATQARSRGYVPPPDDLVHLSNEALPALFFRKQTDENVSL